MVKAEFQRFTNWVTAPVSSQMPLWQVGLLFLILIVVAYMVYDNMDVVTTALSS